MVYTRKELEDQKAQVERRLREPFQHIQNRDWFLKIRQEIDRELARQS